MAAWRAAPGVVLLMMSMTSTAVLWIRSPAGSAAAGETASSAATAPAARPRTTRRQASSSTVRSFARTFRRGSLSVGVLLDQREVVATLELALGVGFLTLRADQFGAVLGVGRTQRGIVVDAVLLEIVEGEHGARAIVDDGKRVARPGIVEPVDVEGDRQDLERVDGIVDHQAGGIAGVGRTDQRQHEVEAAVLRLNAFGRPHADGLAGIFLGALHAEHGGDIEQASQAQRRIHQEARHGGGGATGVTLEDLVDGGERLAQIVEQVADALLRPLRHPVAIHYREGPDRNHVDGAIDRKYEPVGRLDRVPGFGGTRIARC